ncbi:hypothetical protein [Photobacterium sp. J15]|uniref:hypothetical protein n=1 Tax=Photobacterium sp. J15 TaxID=265901 RepID=UPI0007E472EA|nr:hypothetical protein [Photobacterium sp. J15]
MNHLKALRRKLQKKMSKFIAEHEFKSADEVMLSREELNQIITVMIDGRLMLPMFQFDESGQVYSILQEHLPRLLGSDRGGWDICFWLFAEQSVTLKRAVPNAARLRDISVEEMLELGKKSAELTERYIGRPIDAVIDEQSDVFAACVEHLLNPDYRVIPVTNTTEH